MNEDIKKIIDTNTKQVMVDRLREDMPFLLELQKLNARIIRQKFIALKSEGFTDDQALSFCHGSQ